MSRVALARLSIVVGTAAVCGGLLWWWQLRVRAAPSWDARPAADGPDAPGAGESVLLDPASLPGTVLDEEAARILFRGVREGKRQMYDPVAWAVLKPGVAATWRWDEHPDGKIVSRTNNLGFREDADTQVAKQGVRILVAGDSQTEGMVNNGESFANQLEAQLNARPGAVPCEVLNAGVGNTGPQNYLGTLRRNLYLEPDVFVAVLFTGNDFLNALAISDYFTKRRDPKPSGVDEYQRLLTDAHAKYGAIVVDRFNQALKFTQFPETAYVALKAATDAFLEMDRICREEGIGFLAVILPAKPDVDTDGLELYRELLVAVGITEESFDVNARLGGRLAETLRAQGVRVLDATGALRADAGTSHYWARDWHLNVAGHRLVAEALQDEVQPLLPR